MTGLRERQKAGRREDILDAASLLFRRDGFAETSIEEIAVVPGIGPRLAATISAALGTNQARKQDENG